MNEPNFEWMNANFKWMNLILNVNEPNFKWMNLILNDWT